MSSRKPLPLKLSPKARQDFIDILRYTGETWGEKQALCYCCILKPTEYIMKPQAPFLNWENTEFPT